MSILNISLHICSFNVSINVDKNIKIRNHDISRNPEYKKRISEAIEKGKDTQANYGFFNIMF